MLHADAEGLVLEWQAPAFSPRRVIGDDGRPYSELEAPGWPQIDSPGQPQLPYASALAVVPPTGDVTLHLQVLEQVRRPLPHPMVPALAPVPIGTPPTHFEWTWARDEQAYAETGTRPVDIVTLDEAGWQRGRRLIRLTFFPLRFDPAGPALEVAGRVRVELRFQGHPFDDAQNQAAGESRWGDDDPFLPVLQHSVVNPQQVTRFARPEGLTSAPLAPLDTDLTARVAPSVGLDGSPRYKLTISREGVYELTYEALAAAGIPVTTTPRTAYRLEHAGEEVAYEWEGNGNAAFEPGERILFYARPTFTRFADYDIYWLTVGVTGTQAAVRTGDPAGLPPATAWATVTATLGSNRESSSSSSSCS